MTLTEAARLEQAVQDTAWQWTRVLRDDLRDEIETGVPADAWNDQGVTVFSRRMLAGGAR